MYIYTLLYLSTATLFGGQLKSMLFKILILKEIIWMFAPYRNTTGACIFLNNIYKLIPSYSLYDLETSIFLYPSVTILDILCFGTPFNNMD